LRKVVHAESEERRKGSFQTFIGRKRETERGGEKNYSKQRGDVSTETPRP